MEEYLGSGLLCVLAPNPMFCCEDGVVSLTDAHVKLSSVSGLEERLQKLERFYYMTCETNKDKKFYSEQDRKDRKAVGLTPDVDTTPICYKYEEVPKEAWEDYERRERKQLGL